MSDVAVVGAGAQGNVICGVLAGAPEVGRILLVDLDPDRAAEVARFVDSAKIEVRPADASDRAELAGLFSQGRYDLVVNATLPAFNRQVIEAALEVGADYLDMASNEMLEERDGTRVLVEQLEYAGRFEDRGLTAIILAGGDAGLVNVMAREAADELDEVDSIRIRDYGVTECDEPVAGWSFPTYMEDCAAEAVYWEDGEYKWVPPFSGEEDYHFPPPLDVTGTVFFHCHEEPVTIPAFLGKPVRYVDFKMGDPGSAMWRFLIEGLGLMDETPVGGEDCGLSVKDVFCAQLPKTLTPQRCIELVESGRIKSQPVLAVDVVGTKAGERVHYKMWTDSPDIGKACSRIPGANDISWITSIPASILSLMLLRGEIRRTGVFPCEVLDQAERRTFFRGIAEWDVVIHKQVTTDI